MREIMLILSFIQIFVIQNVRNFTDANSNENKKRKNKLNCMLLCLLISISYSNIKNVLSILLCKNNNID